MFGNIEMNFRSLKEPRGFIKCVQAFLSMLVFSLYITTAFNVEYTHKCAKSEKDSFEVKLDYPFIPPTNPFEATFKACNDEKINRKYSLQFKSPSLSRFHVFMSVIAFMYSVGCLIYFVFFELDITQPGADRHQIIFYMGDIGFSLFYFVFGLIACFGVMSVSSNLSHNADVGSLRNALKDFCSEKDSCTVINRFDRSNMIASILFQLVNISVWGFSLYMMWKDQVWKPATTMPYDNDPANATVSNVAAGATTTQGYSATYGNDYEYTYT